MADPIQGVTATEAAGIGSATGPKPKDPAAGTTQAATSAATDTADVTHMQSLLAMIDQVTSALPTVNPDRVAALRQAVADGSYRVDPQSAAKHLADIEQFLSGTNTTG